MKSAVILLVVLFSTFSEQNDNKISGTLEEFETRYDQVTGRFKRFISSNYHNKVGTAASSDKLGGDFESTINDPRYHDPVQESYDFIIVGSGSAGSVLANRLSEIADWKVLLLEVGDEAPPFIDIPAIAAVFQFTDFNWNYLMERQDNMSLGLTDGRMAWPRGRGLGGSTLINYMIQTRGNRHDYDKWADLGNPGWSYRDVFQYFLKSEDATFASRLDAKYHHTGEDGYLKISDVPYRSQVVHEFIKAAQEGGHKYVDYNGRSQLGVGYVQSTLKNGQRWHAERAFLQNAKSRPNLTILTRSRVIKVLIDGNGNAIGVQYVRNKKYRIARATKEVILSAGALSTPQLLILSGIGPKKHLDDLKIPLIQDLPVGRKLYDHICFLGLVFQVNDTITAKQEDLYNIQSFFDLIGKGTGPLTSIGGVESLLYINTNLTKGEPKRYPDIEFIQLSGSLQTDRGDFYRRIFRVSDRVYDAIWKPLEGRHAFSLLPMLMHPKSYGFMELKSTNPYHWPKFYGNYLTERVDVDTFIASIREAQRLIKMPSLAKFGTTLVKTPVPGCEHVPFDSDNYWECALRHLTATLHHQVATCKMGPRNDPEAVVDSKLKVYGVGNLRVVDTSVIPIPLTAHTAAPAYMIGEKAADLIKEEWIDLPYQLIDVRFGTR